MDCVLDLDLDFFVWPISTGRRRYKRLPQRECTHLASDGDVRHFLEERCHLNASVNKPIGHEVVEHDEAFRVFRRWLSECRLTQPFAIIHVDAHADLGAGVNQSFTYLDSLLELPLDQRAYPQFGRNYLNDGNYLLGALANRWVSSLTYVYPAGGGSKSTPSDLPHQCFLNGEYETGKIQLKGYGPGDWMRANPKPKHIEPCVPFFLKEGGGFEFSGFTHMLLAQSPRYTPKSADLLLAGIREYFTEA